MGIFGYLKRELGRKAGWYVLLGITFLGILLMGIGLEIKIANQTTSESFLGSLLYGVGTVITVSGVSGAVLKIFAVEGFFLDAVSEASFGIPGLSRLSNTKLDEVWVNATRILFLNNMVSEKKRNNVGDIAQFREDLESRLKQRIPASESHFVQRSIREIDIKWKDKSNNQIEFKDRTHSIIIPFDSLRPLSFKVRLRTGRHGALNEYDIKEEDPVLVGVKDGLSVSVEVNDKENSITRTYEIAPCEEAEVIRQKTCILPIDKDPNWIGSTPYIFQEMELSVSNQAEGLAVVFSSLGREEAFECLQGAERIEYGEKMKWRLKEIMLPKEGYALTMIRVSSQVG